MAHVLVSLLGKTVGSHDYRQTRYRFDDSDERESKYFGLELASKIKPDKIVILGTSGSMWDNLLAEVVADIDEDRYLAVNEKASADDITQQDLDSWQEQVSLNLDSEVRLLLLPYGVSTHDQIAILSLLANEFEPNDEVTIDVTHGLRHLSMLMFQSVGVLQGLKDVTLRNIYYGALELTQDGVSPVMNLTGLAELSQWESAIAIFDRTGDYMIFEPLFRTAGIDDEILNHMINGSYSEQIGNTAQAQKEIKNFVQKIGTLDLTDKNPLSLFWPAIQQRFSWVEGKDLYDYQKELAYGALEHEQYMRAAIYGYEALITKLAAENGYSLFDYSSRTKAKEAFEEEHGLRTNKITEKGKSYKQLRNIRNAVVHNLSSRDADVRDALSGRQKTSQALKKLFKALIP